MKRNKKKYEKNKRNMGKSARATPAFRTKQKQKPIFFMQ